MTQITRWGILGCGRIARKFASDLQMVPGAELTAVGSRSAESAKAFASEFPVKNMYLSYEALASDPKVDVIYVASPHSHHHEHTLLCLKHDKGVLCEKAFAINLEQANEMVSLAREKRLFLMEALWTKFTPRFRKVQSMIEEGLLGDLKGMQVDFGFLPQEPIPRRIFDPALGGGSLLDIGVYNVFLALTLLGKPEKIEAFMNPAETGVDEQCSIQFAYSNGCQAQLFCSFAANLATEAEIFGNRGRIRLASRFYEPFSPIEFYPGRVDTREIVPFERDQGNGYQYEIMHVQDCLQKGWKESPVMSHTDTLLLMETLDRIRQIAGIRYPADL